MNTYITDSLIVHVSTNKDTSFFEVSLSFK